MDIFFRYFTIILAFIVVILILLLTTKYLAYKSKKMMKGNHMHVVESLSLGVNIRLHLIKVDKEFFIISSTNKSVEFLARVNIDNYEEEVIKNPISEVIDFKSVLKKYVGGFNSGSHEEKGREPYQADRETGNTGEIVNDDVMFKKNLEKLKNLTNSGDDEGREDE